MCLKLTVPADGVAEPAFYPIAAFINLQLITHNLQLTMVEGINYITDESGNEKGIILDLIAFKKHNIKESDVLKALSGLQKLIDRAGTDKKKANNWDSAKEQLKNLKPPLED